MVGPIAGRWQQHSPADDLAARATANSAQDAAPNAVVLTAADRETFALWYGVYGLNARPDVAVVNVSLFGFDWYRRSLAERHPDLLPSGDDVTGLEELIPGWLARRPVYATADVGLPLRLGAKVPPSGVLAPVLGSSQ